MNESDASFLQLLGAGGFGAVIGWYVYYVNRYRKADVQLGDVVTLIGAIGGAAVLTLFPAKTDLFGAYGVGLAVGFFGYFAALLLMVAASKKFKVEWFLDGRRQIPDDDEVIPEEIQPTIRAMRDEGKLPG
jgi:hypothetical protein